MAIEKYIPITDAELDPSDPGTTGLFARLRDNPIAISFGADDAPQYATGAIDDLAITNAKFADGSVTAAKLAGSITGSSLGAAAVSQTNLKTTLLLNYTKILNVSGVAPWQFSYHIDHEYSFYPRFRSDGGLTFSVTLSGHEDGTFGNVFTITNTDSTAGLFGMYVRGVDASPPYDLGDGPVPAFVYLHIREGRRVAVGYSRRPPWHGREARPDFYWGGAAYKLRKMTTLTLADVKGGRCSPSEFAAANTNAEWVAEEVTTKSKNAGMERRPHPFVLEDGDVVAMLDPVGKLAEQLSLIADTEEDLGAVIFKHVEFDNTPLTRAMPPGVIAVSGRWKYTR